MSIQEYVDELNRRYKSGYSREHSYRGDLQSLLESILPDILVTNEPKRSDVGAPDYILTKNNIPIGYVEAKDIEDPDLRGKKKNKEQFNRYKDGLTNLIFTDYLDFHLYREGEFITSLRIAKVVDGEVKGEPEKYDQFRDLIKDFGTHVGQTIRSANKLSKMMAGKARLLANVIENALNADQKKIDKGNYQANNTLREQLSAFQNILIHDIGAKEFADIYAQTIAYGMFAARLHDLTLETFDRREAAELIPKTNPFLRRLFGYIAGPNIDERIVWIVDGLADIFRATDVDGLLKNFGKATKQHDPIIHFYETFLAEYDPSLRKSRGVWYTPEPVVNFIVRAIDDILKDEFGLKDGLANTSKTKVKVKVPTHDKRHKGGMVEEEREVHKVQILDPATGTGTFLAEVIKQIHSKFEGQQGIWATYVEEHLIPRMNGFEILMASYAMAHLKLDLLLRETGVEPSGSERFRVYLTNSLEEHHPDTGTLFAGWLSEEANEANHIKRDTPVMVVLGNPPYSVSSRNKGEWIEELMKDYKRNLNERNIQPLSDDYIKFIRYGQYLIDKNGEGILAYVSNNSFIDGIIHKRMRQSLLQSFNDVYIIDLHGNSNKKETTPTGGKDENVFDIQQGVSINIFVKKSGENTTSKLGKVHQFDLYGLRKKKYKELNKLNWSNDNWLSLKSSEPNFFFIPKDYELEKKFKKGFSIYLLFKEKGRGISFRKDGLLVKPHDTVDSVKEMISDVVNLSNSEILKKYSFNETKNWKLDDKRQYFELKNEASIRQVLYRPFDHKFTFYPLDIINQIIVRGDDKRSLMQHMIMGNNLALICPKQSLEGLGTLITDTLSENKSVSAYNANYFFPLYLYPKESSQQTLGGKPVRTSNLDKKIVNEIVEKLGLKFTSEKDDTEEVIAPIDILDYTYAVLHSPSYREKYKEFLKNDFPSIPYPEDQELFWRLVHLGGKLRQIHLLEHPIIEDFITTYPESGSNIVSNRLTKREPGFIPNENDESIGRVWINDAQYFGNVPKKAWEFYIGGYQPAEKWLKDRRDQELSIKEIQHYQKIIVALTETHRLMQEVDKVFSV